MEPYLAGLTGGLAAFFLGALWYGPLFGQTYRAGVAQLGRKGTAPPMGPSMLVALLLLNLIAAIGIGTLYDVTAFSDSGIGGGLLLGVLGWAVAVSVLKSQAITLHLPRRITWVTAGYQLAAFLVYGLVAALWLG